MVCMGSGYLSLSLSSLLSHIDGDREIVGSESRNVSGGTDREKDQRINCGISFCPCGCRSHTGHCLGQTAETTGTFLGPRSSVRDGSGPGHPGLLARNSL